MGLPKPQHLTAQIPTPEHPRDVRVPYLQEGLLLLQVLADHGGDVIRLGVGAQFVGTPTPVLFPLVLLLQALQDAADLWAGRGGRVQTGVFPGLLTPKARARRKAKLPFSVG